MSFTKDPAGSRGAPIGSMNQDDLGDKNSNPGYIPLSQKPIGGKNSVKLLPKGLQLLLGCYQQGPISQCHPENQHSEKRKTLLHNSHSPSVSYE